MFANRPVNLTYSSAYVTIDSSAWDFPQAFLMVNLPPFRDKYRFPNFKLNIKLGGLLLCLSLFLDYQPAIAFPPIKRNVVFAEITQEQSVSPQISPVSFQLPHPGYITTHFSSYHPGIDLCSGLGMPIKTIAKGRVVEAGYNFFGLGLVVEVEHEGGYRSLYAHMGKIFVEKGKEVDVNDFLGEIGMTGHTSGPHTHLEISKDGKKIDPLLILPEIRKYPNEADFVTITSATPSAVAIPVIKPVSSESAQVVTKAAASTSAAKIKEDIEEVKETAEEQKIDLKEKSVSNILNLVSPKPTASPAAQLPQGGKVSFRNFALFASKK